jgi:hypothetical protein
MRTSSIFYILIGCILATASAEAFGRRISCCSEPSRAQDGEHGIPGYFEDGEHGQNGEHGKNGQDGGHGGDGGSSVHGNGGNGGNGGDAD